MIQTTANYDAAAKVMPRRQLFRFSIADYSRVFVYRPTGRENEVAWIAGINDWGVSVDPTNGSYTIDDLVVKVIDKGAAVTKDLGLLALEGRRCTLQMGFPGLDLTDYCTLFQGIVGSVTTNNDGTYNFTCQDYNRLNQRVIYTQGNTDDETVTTTTLNTGQPFTVVTRTDYTNATGGVSSSAVITYAQYGPNGPTGSKTSTAPDGTITQTTVTSRQVNPGGGNITVYESTVIVTAPNGTKTTTTTTYGDQNLYGLVTVTTSIDSTTGIQTDSVAVTFSASGTEGTVQTSDNALISSSNPRRVIGHPLDVLLNILQVQIGFADSDINVAQIQGFRDSVFSGIVFDFTLTGSVDAKDFIESQLLKPLAGYLYTNGTGQICVGFAQPQPGGITLTSAINPYNVKDIPAVGASDLVNVVTMRFDKDDANVGNSSTGYLSESNTFYAPTINDLTDLTSEVAQEDLQGTDAVQGQLIIESDGLRSGFQGYLISAIIANALFAMYGLYNPTMDCECHWNAMFRTELAEFTGFTHPLVPNKRAGVMGFVNAPFQVIKRTYHFSSDTVSVSLIDASGVTAFGAHRIQPAATATTYGAGSAAAHARYIYMTDSNGKQSGGDSGALLG